MAYLSWNYFQADFPIEQRTAVHTWLKRLVCHEQHSFFLQLLGHLRLFFFAETLNEAS